MEKIKKFILDNKVLLITTFCFTILVFSYFGVSTVINNDGVLDFIIDDTTNAGYKLYLSVGRWGWALIGLIFNYYPSPILYLFINAILFSLATYYLCKIFDIKKTSYQVLIGMILISFPINIYAYSYSSWQNSIGIAFFCSIYAIYLLKNAKNFKDYLLSSLIISFVIGIYQMFLHFVAVLLVYVLIIEFVDNKDIKKLIKKFFKCFLTFLLASIIYYIIVKLTTFIFQIDMNNYQSANKMFDFNFLTFIKQLPINLGICFIPNNITFFPLSCHIALILIFTLNIIISIKKERKPSKQIILILLFIILLISPQIIRFVKPKQWFHEVTLIPYTIFYTGAVALFIKQLSDFKIKNKNSILNTLNIILIIVITLFVINDNKGAVMAKNASNAAYAYVNRLQMRIEETDGYDKLSKTKKYYFIGKLNFYEFPYSERAYYHLTGLTTNFVFYPPNLVDAINVLGINAIYYNDKIDIETKDIIENMAISYNPYPSSESIFIYNDIVVIKLK